MNDAKIAMAGQLGTQLTRHKGPHTARSLRIPGLGRIILTRDPGDATIFAREVFASELTAHHRDGDGRLVHSHDLGSGLVTNVGVTALANDFAWAANAQTLKLANFHACGTGTTAAAATDIALQTPAAPTATTATAGTQSLVSAANSQTYKTTVTFSYTAAEAITEWGLHTAAALSAATGSPFTATTATSATVTGAPYTASTASVQGEQQLIVKAGTTASYGLVLANTTSVLTIPAWYSTTTGATSATPGATEAFTLLPVLWDHKTFAAINVASGDSISFSYSLAVNSGG